MEIAGSVAIITGGASGIGLATAIKFAEEGAECVVLADVNEEALTEAAELVTAAGAKAIPVKTDVSDLASLENMYSICIEQCGRVDIVFNNAGIVTGAQSYPETPPERIKLVLEIDLIAVIISSQIAIGHMRNTGGGVIINTGSTASFNPSLNEAPYTSAKAGVLMFSKSCKDLKGLYNIRVNALCPGITETPILNKTGGGDRPEWLHSLMQEKRIWTAEDVAINVMNICRDEEMYGDYILMANEILD